MSQIHITAKGIRAALKKYTPLQSLVEYIWNGFDAQASVIEIAYDVDEMGGVERISIADNGYGIPQQKLQEKFEPVFESRKALENMLKKNKSAIHGKNGIGRLTFFTFARHAQWKTIFNDNEKRFEYEIYANAESINLYSGVNAVKKETDLPTGTQVTFTGVHSITRSQLETEFQQFLIREFAWFLELNKKNNFQILLNGKVLDYESYVAEREMVELEHGDSRTIFAVEYVRWQGKMNTEQSKYYYLNSEGREMWKEPTAIRNKGEKFYHSIYIASDYFDAFNFKSVEDGQQPLIGGVRSDKQFKFLRRKVANFLRIKRKPFLKTYAENLLREFEKAKVFDEMEKEGNAVHVVILKQFLKVLYQMQPRLFNGLNLEQKKWITGMMSWLLKSDQQEKIPEVIGTIIELNEEELKELKDMIQ